MEQKLREGGEEILQNWSTYLAQKKVSEGGVSWAGRKNERGRRKGMRRQPKRASQPGEHSAA